MRLSDVLSKSIRKDFLQVDGFLTNKKGNIGQQIKLNVGQVALNYFCMACDDIRTFNSKGELSCVFVNKHVISIDCVLTCGCNASVQVWFLVEAEDDICGQAPKVRIMKRSEKLSDMVKIRTEKYGEFSTLLDMAERAYRDDLGAGAIIYLRKAFEKITIQMADAIEIEYKKYKGGNPIKFSELLKKVDEKCTIIPKEFASDGYRLFQELSDVVHGEYDEALALSKFESLHTLVVGILDNVSKSRELKMAINSLGWEESM